MFGDDDDDEISTKDIKRGSGSGKNAKGKHVPEAEVEEEVIDLANMGKRGVI